MVVFLCQYGRAQRNVVLIIADDIGPEYFSCYGNTHEFPRTPTLDSLSRAGVFFTNAWSAPICSPTRAMILTGRYPFRTGIGAAVKNASYPDLYVGEFTIPKALKTIGVTSANIGKFHLGTGSQFMRRNPIKLGFDYYSGHIGGQIGSYFNWPKTSCTESWIQINNDNTYATVVNVNESIEWIGQQEGNWFLWLAFNTPHVPYHVPPGHLHSYTLSGHPADMAANPKPYYFASLEAMDREINRLINFLRETGRAGETDFIFLGDNGTPGEVRAPGFNANKMKGTIHEGGIRIPLFISGPSVLNGGRSSDELVSVTDLFTTIIEMNGISLEAVLPADTAIDAVSLMPVLRQTGGTGREWVFSEKFDVVVPEPRFDGKCIRNHDYKLIVFDNRKYEFYYIRDDFHETSDLLKQPMLTEEQGCALVFLCETLSTLLNTNYCDEISGMLTCKLSGMIPGIIRRVRSKPGLTLLRTG